MNPLTRYDLDSDEFGPRMTPTEDGDYYAKDEADARFAELERDRNAWRNTAIAASSLIAAAEAERDAARADAERNRVNAERYEWLRRCHWSDSPLCVVSVPKESTILGAYLPSFELLDAAIDAARGKE